MTVEKVEQENTHDVEIEDCEMERFVNSRVTQYVPGEPLATKPVHIRYPLRKPWRSYTEKPYWDKRYDERLQHTSELGGTKDDDEWYGSGSLSGYLIKRSLASLEHPEIRRILHLGCGLSKLGEELAQLFPNAKRVTNLDFSGRAIRYWQTMDTIGEYIEGDVTDMRSIVPAQTQQLVVDKACFDGLTNESAEQMLLEVCRVLSSEAIFICISSSRRMLTRALNRIEAREAWTVGKLVYATDIKQYRTDKDDDYVYVHVCQNIMPGSRNVSEQIELGS
ncbi:hypothetical protein FOL47_004656 [Perkinsus chesapeaki]|uniref:Methyltransferase domain-containing protein n=1 Tax=Perkinsus chesapeaki TaxID=330153 RepID=A0A7J6M1I0_PERCH|nr:hypothetical protein FOL47_004656 [Perkinsus chesapeaki]